MTSVTNSIFDIAGAFVQAEDPDFLGPNRTWNATNAEQADFLPFLQLVKPYVPNLKADGLLDARIAWLAKEINDWFKERGFSIELKQQGPDTFYVGSIYEQLVRWSQEGSVRPLRGRNGVTYPDAVQMDSDSVQYFTAPAFNGPIAAISTQGPDVAYMVKLDAPPQDPFGLLRLAKQAMEQMTRVRKYGDLSFPMAHLDVTTDVNWLIGLWTQRDSGQKAWVSEAKQQSILKLNNRGALAKSAFGMAVTLECTFIGEPVVMDSPFLFWINREDYPLPLFAAWVDYTDWKNPGELE